MILHANYVAGSFKAGQRPNQAFPGVIAVDGINRRYGRSIHRGPLVGVLLGKALAAAIVATALSVWLLIHFHS